MIKARLKSTTNKTMKKYVGREGNLEIEETRRFHFYFQDGEGVRDLTSVAIAQLGDFEHPASEEICFETQNSTYVFTKLENVGEKLFDFAINNSGCI